MPFIGLQVSESQRSRYRLAAARASIPVSTWIKTVLDRDDEPSPTAYEPFFGQEGGPRRKVASVPLTEDEHAYLKARAEECGLSLAAYLRQAALAGEPPKPRPGEPTREALRQLRRLSANINQLAQKIHAAARGTLPPDLMPCASDLQEARAGVLAWIRGHE